MPAAVSRGERKTGDPTVIINAVATANRSAYRRKFAYGIDCAVFGGPAGTGKREVGGQDQHECDLLDQNSHLFFLSFTNKWRAERYIGLREQPGHTHASG